MKEEDIQKWVSNIIKEDRIRDFIENFESTINLNTIENPNYIPSFSLDYLLHKKAKKAASAILSSFYSLQIISEDQNISKTKSEALRPDILELVREFINGLRAANFILYCVGFFDYVESSISP